ncbi:MAG: tyrosine-type recombinase/integrase [Actinobacteria bacterium]|nr:tyrosine-type recombinase/integrase [Actinomycetota bacterium]
MTALRSHLHDYLRIRRQLGFELKEDGRLLERFVDFLEQASAPRVTTELALMWARLPVEAHPHRWRQRLGIVRGFARHLATIDPASEVPSEDLLPAHRPRVRPYIYSPAEIAALIQAARTVTPPLRAASYETLIGLMAATGVRIGEALGLDRADVDLKDGALHIRAGRQSKQREVALHHSTTQALRQYSRLRDRHWPKPKTTAFFLTVHGARLSRPTVNRAFPELLRRAGLEGCGERQRPRPHDLRHTFAVRTLLDWYRAGEEVDRKMPLLSTYLGHVNPESTYWYLQAVPELLALVGRRLEQLPEVLS